MTFNEGAYNPDGTFKEQMAKNIRLNPPCQPNMLPTQERYRMILKKERFGGTCDIMVMAKNKTGKNDMLVSWLCVTLSPKSLKKRIPQRNPYEISPIFL